MADDFLSYLAKKVKDTNEEYTGKVRDALGTSQAKGPEFHDPEYIAPRTLEVTKTSPIYANAPEYAKEHPETAVADGVADVGRGNQGDAVKREYNKREVYGAHHRNEPVVRNVIEDAVLTSEGRQEEGRARASAEHAAQVAGQQQPKPPVPTVAMEAKFVPHEGNTFDPARDLQKAVKERFGSNDDPAFAQKLATMKATATKSAAPYVDNPLAQMYYGAAMPVHDKVVKPAVEAAVKKFPLATKK